MSIINFAEPTIGLLFFAILSFALIMFGGLAFFLLWLKKRRNPLKFKEKARCDQSVSDKKIVSGVVNNESGVHRTSGGDDIAHLADLSDRIEKSHPTDDIKTEADDYSKMLAQFAKRNLGDFMLAKPKSKKSVL